MSRFKINCYIEIFFIKCNFIIIVIGTILYFVNNIFIKKISAGVAYLNYFINCYFNDILAGTIIIALINIILILFINKKINKLIYIFLLLLVIGYFWEYVPNLIKENAITDICDIVAYEIGGFIYWICIQYINKKRSE